MPHRLICAVTVRGVMLQTFFVVAVHLLPLSSSCDNHREKKKTTTNNNKLALCALGWQTRARTLPRLPLRCSHKKKEKKKMRGKKKKMDTARNHTNEMTLTPLLQKRKATRNQKIFVFFFVKRKVGKVSNFLRIPPETRSAP